MTTKQKPIHEARLGAIKAAIWENATANGTRHSVTFSRIYREDGQWKHAENFRRDELLVAAKVADLAHTWIIEQSQTKEEAPA
jgi:hypothetical protein